MSTKNIQINVEDLLTYELVNLMSQNPRRDEDDFDDDNDHDDDEIDDEDFDDEDDFDNEDDDEDDYER